MQLNNTGVNMEKRDMLEKRQEKWSKQFLTFSMGFFICITSSLTMVTVISNLTLTYQARNILVEIINEPAIYKDLLTTLQSSSISTEKTDEPTSAMTSDTNSPIITQQSSTTAFTDDSITPQLNISTTTTTDIYDSTTVTPTKRNPIVILNELNQKATYFCTNRSDSPPVIAARLNLSLSQNGKGDNYLLLTMPVRTTDKRVAKRRVAYLAIESLYKDHVNEAAKDEEWEFNVPPESEFQFGEAWGACK